jgi:hypothetical protein
MECDDKIELIIGVCHRCADILKDPTSGGKAEMSADLRAGAREDAYNNLLTAIDALAACAQYHNGFYDVLSIASKLKIDGATK